LTVTAKLFTFLKRTQLFGGRELQLEAGLPNCSHKLIARFISSRCLIAQVRIRREFARRAAEAGKRLMAEKELTQEVKKIEAK
jgi:hypothetical protein